MDEKYYTIERTKSELKLRDKKVTNIDAVPMTHPPTTGNQVTYPVDNILIKQEIEKLKKEELQERLIRDKQIRELRGELENFNPKKKPGTSSSIFDKIMLSLGDKAVRTSPADDGEFEEQLAIAKQAIPQIPQLPASPIYDPDAAPFVPEYEPSTREQIVYDI